jgi:hypothetical protein
MRLFHRTTRAAVDTIVTDGFRDGHGNYLTESQWSGVWLSDTPLDENEGANGDVLLEVTLDIPNEELADWEWVEEGKPYREWLIPAAVVNPGAKIREISEYDEPD